MAAQGEKLSAQTKLDFKPHFDSLQAKLEAAKARVVDIASAADDKLVAVVAAIETGLTTSRRPPRARRTRSRRAPIGAPD